MRKSCLSYTVKRYLWHWQHLTNLTNRSCLQQCSTDSIQPTIHYLNLKENKCKRSIYCHNFITINPVLWFKTLILMFGRKQWYVFRSFVPKSQRKRTLIGVFSCLNCNHSSRFNVRTNVYDLIRRCITVSLKVLDDACFVSIENCWTFDGRLTDRRHCKLHRPCCKESWSVILKSWN